METLNIAQEKKRIQDQMEKLSEQFALLSRYEELAGQSGTVSETKTVKVKAEKAPKAPKSPPADGQKRGRGRPPGSKNKPKDGSAPATSSETAEKPMKLPELLMTFLSEVNKPLRLSDFVTMAREAGYKSKAKKFENVVYQTLHKLVEAGVLKRDGVTREYAKAA